MGGPPNGSNTRKQSPALADPAEDAGLAAEEDDGWSPLSLGAVGAPEDEDDAPFTLWKDE